MLKALFGYKIMFTFDMPDGTLNGGICNSPESLVIVFQRVAELHGSNLMIKDETIYLQEDESELREEAKETERSADAT